MRVLRINRDLSVDELDLPEDEWMDPGVTWDATEIAPGHDVWSDDEGMFDPGSVMARVGPAQVPLPAWVAGARGEMTVDATMTVEQLTKLIR